MASIMNFDKVLQQLQSAAAQTTYSVQEFVDAISGLAASGNITLEEAAQEVEQANYRTQFVTLNREYKTLQYKH